MHGPPGPRVGFFTRARARSRSYKILCVNRIPVRAIAIFKLIILIEMSYSTTCIISLYGHECLHFGQQNQNYVTRNIVGVISVVAVPVWFAVSGTEFHFDLVCIDFKTSIWFPRAFIMCGQREAGKEGEVKSQTTVKQNQPPSQHSQ